MKNVREAQPAFRPWRLASVTWVGLICFHGYRWNAKTYSKATAASSSPSYRMSDLTSPAELSGLFIVLTWGCIEGLTWVLSGSLGAARLPCGASWRAVLLELMYRGPE